MERLQAQRVDLCPRAPGHVGQRAVHLHHRVAVAGRHLGGERLLARLPCRHRVGRCLSRGQRVGGRRRLLWLLLLVMMVVVVMVVLQVRNTSCVHAQVALGKRKQAELLFISFSNRLSTPGVSGHRTLNHHEMK